MFEHRSYLPSLAFCTGSVAYLHHVMSRGYAVRKNVVFGGLCLAAAVFSVFTVQRNHLYSSRLSIWNDTVKKSPDKYRPYAALGTVYLEKRLYDQAILCFVKSLELNPEYIESYLSLGSIYLTLGMPHEAINLYEQYLSSHRPEPSLLPNLALAYADSGMLQEAIDTMKLALHVVDEDVQQLGFIAELNLRMGNVHEAQRYLAQARETDHNDPDVDLSTSLNRLEAQIQARM